MSIDVLGQVVRKLVQLSQEELGILSELLKKLTSAKSDIWFAALKRFLRRENPWVIPKIIEVTTDGRSGEQFIADLEGQGNRVSGAKELLRSKEFVVSDGKTYKLAVISGDDFEDSERTNENIRAKANERGYLEPSMEIAPYLCEMFSDEELEQMGIRALHRHAQALYRFGRQPESAWCLP